MDFNGTRIVHWMLFCGWGDHGDGNKLGIDMLLISPIILVACSRGLIFSQHVQDYNQRRNRKR